MKRRSNDRPQEPEVERAKQQDDSDIRCQPFPGPDSVSEEPEIHSDYSGHHRQCVQHENQLSGHFRPLSNLKSARLDDTPQALHLQSEPTFLRVTAENMATG
jgi:hypothetical protein